MPDSPQEALDKLLELVGNADAGVHAERARVLAFTWPSLAMAFADLLAAHDMRVPRPFRAAANVLAAEDTRAVAGMGSCATCGHVQHQHGERGCYQCTLCSGFQPLRAPQPLDNGPWCFCPNGASNGGRGHLKGEGSCDSGD